MNYSKNKLRPTLLSDIIGQTNILDRLNVSIQAAKLRHEPLGSCCLYGFPGSGKTTVALAIANEMECEIQVSNGANLRSVKDILPYLVRIKEGGILFIDEIHEIGDKPKNLLLTAIDDKKVPLGKDKNMVLDLPDFTFICATTNPGKIAGPLLDRMVFQYQFQPYSTTELIQIIQQSAKKLTIEIDDPSCLKLANVSKGNPRLANNNLLFVRDFIDFMGVDRICVNDIDDIFALLNIKNGLDANDRAYLSVVEKHSPVGLSTLVSLSGLTSDTITQIIEPNLLKLGLIKKTKKGRVLVK